MVTLAQIVKLAQIVTPSYRTQEMVEKKISKEPRFLHLTVGNRP